MIIMAPPRLGWPREVPAVELSPGLDWIDRVLGRAAVDPTFRHLLLTAPALALTGEPLPAGLLAAICTIEASDLGQFARCALAAQAAVPLRVRPADAPRIIDELVSAAA